ncbi:MAG: S8 family serine peptidase [candidate division Zixibacteria bacterium]|nr:S8 family serine peptidase [candidate division Zixibacteria bacterium]
MKTKTQSRLLTVWALVIAVILTGSTYAQHGHNEYRPEEVVCAMAPGYTIDSINAAFGTTVKSHLIQTDCYLLMIPSGQNADSLAAVIAARPDVLYCSPNFYIDAPEPFQRSSPFLDDQLTGDVETQTAAVSLDMTSVHTLATGVNVDIAVIDGGVNFTHPEFTTDSVALISGWDYIDDDPVANDEPGGACSGHGTFVAGILKLVAPESRMHAYRVLDTTGRGTGFAIAAAVLRAVDDGCRVINLSLGMVGVDDALDEALKYAKMNDVMVVASAGNDSTAENTIFPFPASHAYCLAVAALDTLNIKAIFSNYGLKVDYCAPGTGIYAPYMDTSYAWWDGTSFATPFVTGLAALLISRDPTLNWEQIDTLIAASAVNVDSLNPGFEGLLGHGLIDMVAALEALDPLLIGDANTDSIINIGDAVFIINYIFRSGPPPIRLVAADANCDGRINVGDAVFIIRYLFSSGPAPCSAG